MGWGAFLHSVIHLLERRKGSSGSDGVLSSRRHLLSAKKPSSHPFGLIGLACPFPAPPDECVWKEDAQKEPGESRGISLISSEFPLFRHSLQVWLHRPNARSATKKQGADPDSPSAFPFYSLRGGGANEENKERFPLDGSWKTDPKSP